ncbi:MAG: anhydro-N-acetylmuramic acid kinase [Crocinitomix sp. MedPE-SWsnd]|nr:MAG: anhydro-N-acetylmuramic acid kinase [Crocinitomix sp. MedPE-SWsnd]
MAKSKRIIGLMSGTSLDGLDVCCADFSCLNGVYSFELVATNTFKYSDTWVEKLRSAIKLDAAGIQALEKDFAMLMSQFVKIFSLENGLNESIDFVASHGHTVFHEPQKQITVQVGDGQIMANELSVKVINDFRIGDVLLGGQGAPLVPIGDKLLFAEYQACLNLGGISNISFQKEGERIAFDIGPANIPLNYIVKEKYNLNYDKDGAIAQSGSLIPELYQELSALEFYNLSPPKSLGFEWMDANIFPLVEKYKAHPTANVLNTIVRHEVFQIHKVCAKNNIQNVLVTGGGAYNLFFMKCLKENTNAEFVIPDIKLVDFKEALIFGFLGFLKDRGEDNILSSVTGASSDSCGGKIHIPST